MAAHFKHKPSFIHLEPLGEKLAQHEQCQGTLQTSRDSSWCLTVEKAENYPSGKFRFYRERPASAEPILQFLDNNHFFNLCKGCFTPSVLEWVNPQQDRLKLTFFSPRFSLQNRRKSGQTALKKPSRHSPLCGEGLEGFWESFSHFFGGFEAKTAAKKI